MQAVHSSEAGNVAESFPAAAIRSKAQPAPSEAPSGAQLAADAAAEPEPALVCGICGVPHSGASLGLPVHAPPRAAARWGWLLRPLDSLAQRRWLQPVSLLLAGASVGALSVHATSARRLKALTARVAAVEARVAAVEERVAGMEERVAAVAASAKAPRWRRGCGRSGSAWWEPLGGGEGWRTV
ncbi:hypothetical protein HYH03_010509 [Edaphochlamys debaryana]|uniref:Uncharacterized protein n=1 Tax=Edaphochlamys debaryana TaxID=47281 RepID=A0A835XXY0_9CHLO|nr:hypothetical protein HYH03_010509 [Edaphochlamys debaryana]|eukprot:KAG2491063.1 hypothetical protein HYH03_010509 [Edaphochlamys debaryana]